MRIFCLLTLLFVLSCTTGNAQQKKNLMPEDYGKWQQFGNMDLSPNGEWIAYNIGIQLDNDTLYVVNRLTNKTYKLEFATQFEFAKDNQWIAYRIGLPFKEAEKLRDDGKPIEFKMGLLNLSTGKKEIIAGISRFEFSKKGNYLAVSLTPPKENKEKGNVVLIRNLAEGTTHTIGNVTEYAFNKKGDYLAYIVEAANSAGNAVELLSLQNYALKIVASDTLKFSKLTWQKRGRRFVFLQNIQTQRL